MRLKKNKVRLTRCAWLGGVSAKKMIQPDFEKIRDGRITGQMSAQFAAFLVGANHHGQCVPANDGRDLTLQPEIPRIAWLAGGRNCVAIRRIEQLADFDAAGTG